MKIKSTPKEVWLDSVKNANDLKPLLDWNFYKETVNVTRNVFLNFENLKNLPVKFGTIRGSFNCNNNFLTSLEGAPREVGCDFFCSFNKLTSLEDIHKIIKKIDGRFWVTNNPIKSGGIGLLLIEGITGVQSDLPALSIINTYIGQGNPGLLRCQEELIENDYEEFAKL